MLAEIAEAQKQDKTSKKPENTNKYFTELI
jgi:hypothetical protein